MKTAEQIAKELFRIVHGAGDGGSEHAFNCLNPSEQDGWLRLAKKYEKLSEKAWRYDSLQH